MPRYHVRRTDRELTDAAQIDAILTEGRYVTIAFARENEPYLVTMSYGFDAARRALYFHAATEGLKYEFMEANPAVCATVVLDGGYVRGECEHNYTSAVVRGRLSRVTDPVELRYGMRALLDHLEKGSPEYAEAPALERDEAYERMAVLRLDIGEITAKRGK
ncbi:MAG: pyridoxamine 5'-phosphate oxidase family protein [Anaerosomatales bacterium]|nr:pyridoxamine 5'-phosphate oxidase family protein [Anaerosomatales bacterium]MDT8433921.1 pyridoxamine 5'-phosphate oxidase family protein [Anaerosomatales bacterium]